MGIEPARVRFEYISASEGQRFASVVTEFVGEIKKIGPNSLKF
jgi:F420-non-reducing hydrogenase iron-sulfur subunit